MVDLSTSACQRENIGNQNYILEGDFDPNQYQVIAIWCQRLSRNFGAVDVSKITIRIYDKP